MKGIFEHFPEDKIHEKETFKTNLSNGKLQQKLIRVLGDINGKTFTFEQIGNPTIPGCTVIFEAGIGDANSFTFINEEEVRKMLTVLKKQSVKNIDFFFAIRYYRDYKTKKKPLKFDYYMVRFVFTYGLHEVQVFHERGPRYIQPKDLIAFLVKSICEPPMRKTARKPEHSATSRKLL